MQPLEETFKVASGAAFPDPSGSELQAHQGTAAPRSSQWSRWLDGGSSARDSPESARSGIAPPRPPWMFALSMSGSSPSASIESLRDSSRARGTSQPQSSRTAGAGGDGTQTTSGASSGAGRDGFARRQIEAMEERLGGRISRLQKQFDALHEQALAHVDAKVGALDALQPKLDRRLAELSASYQVLSDETQAQIRRADAADQRLFEWKRQLEEIVRAKQDDHETQIQGLSSAHRVLGASNEDTQKGLVQKLKRLEGLVEDLMRHSEETRCGVVDVHGRLADIEERHHTLLADAEVTGLECGARHGPSQKAGPHLDDKEGSADTIVADHRIADVERKVDNLLSEFPAIHARGEAQEERLRTLRTLHDARDDHHRRLNERIEGSDWDGRLRELQRTVEDRGRKTAEHQEQIELMAHQLKRHEQAHEDVGSELRRLHHVARGSAGDLESSMPPASTRNTDGRCVDADAADRSHSESAVDSQVESCLARMRDIEGRIDATGDELRALKAERSHDEMLAKRVDQLLAQLSGVAPRIVEHERRLREHSSKHEEQSVGSDGLTLRVGRLEVRFERFSSGASEMPPNHGLERFGGGDDTEAAPTAVAGNDRHGLAVDSGWLGASTSPMRSGRHEFGRALQTCHEEQGQ